MAVIVFSCILLAVETPQNTDNPVLVYLGTICTIIFTIEFIMKSIARGMLGGNYAYLADSWNRLDFAVLLLAYVAFGVPDLRFARALRGLRVLRIMVRNDKIKVVVLSLWHAIPAIVNVLMFVGMFWIIFGILGVNLFAGTFWYCTDESIEYQADCTGNYTLDGVNDERHWLNVYQNFDNIFYSIRTIFQISTLSDWISIMHYGIDSTEPGRVGVEGNRPLMALYFISLVIVCAFVTLDNFDRLRAEFNGSAFMTSTQRAAAESQQRLDDMTLPTRGKPPVNETRRKFFALTDSGLFESFIMGCILLNCVVMSLDYDGMSESYQNALEGFNVIFVVIFTVEMVLKLIALGPKQYVEDAWNRFDGSLVLLSYVGYIPGLQGGSGLNVIRLFRICRLFRLVKRFKRLSQLFETLMAASPAMVNIGMFLAVIFYLFAVIAVALFGHIVHSDDGLDDHANFENFGNALLTLYRLATADGWEAASMGSGVAEPFCEPELDNCGDDLLATVFFSLFMLVGALVMVNLFIGVILENFNKKDFAIECTDRFRTAWIEVDKFGVGMLAPHHTYGIIYQSHFIKKLPFRMSRMSSMLRIKHYKLTLYRLAVPLYCGSFLPNDKLEAMEKASENLISHSFSDHPYSVFEYDRLAASASQKKGQVAPLNKSISDSKTTVFKPNTAFVDDKKSPESIGDVSPTEWQHILSHQNKTFLSNFTEVLSELIEQSHSLPQHERSGAKVQSQVRHVTFEETYHTRDGKTVVSEFSYDMTLSKLNGEWVETLPLTDWIAANLIWKNFLVHKKRKIAEQKADGTYEAKQKEEEERKKKNPVSWSYKYVKSKLISFSDPVADQKEAEAKVTQARAPSSTGKLNVDDKAPATAPNSSVSVDEPILASQEASAKQPESIEMDNVSNLTKVLEEQSQQSQLDASVEVPGATSVITTPDTPME